jgi:hypothetical protein
MANRHKFKRGGRHPDDKLGYSGHHSEKEKGGIHGDDYSGSGEPNVVKEGKNTKDGFKKGGHVHGKKAKHHRGKKYARGGRHGGSPFSSAHVKTDGDA